MFEIEQNLGNLLEVHPVFNGLLLKFSDRRHPQGSFPQDVMDKSKDAFFDSSRSSLSIQGASVDCVKGLKIDEGCMVSASSGLIELVNNGVSEKPYQMNGCMASPETILFSGEFAAIK